MGRRGKPKANGVRIPWDLIDPSLHKFVRLRALLPHRRGKNARVKGTAPTYDEIAQAYNDTVLEEGSRIKGAHILLRLLRNHGDTPSRQKKES